VIYFFPGALREGGCGVRISGRGRCSPMWTWRARVRPDHTLRTIRQLTDVALAALNPDFSALYAARMARPSIPPEMLL
jgi:hypothetical protein